VEAWLHVNVHVAVAWSINKLDDTSLTRMIIPQIESAGVCQASMHGCSVHSMLCKLAVSGALLARWLQDA